MISLLSPRKQGVMMDNKKPESDWQAIKRVVKTMPWSAKAGLIVYFGVVLVVLVMAVIFMVIGHY